MCQSDKKQNNKQRYEKNRKSDRYDFGQGIHEQRMGQMDFAIVHCGEVWKKLIRKRMEAIQIIAEDSELCSVRYYGASVDFFPNGR